MSQGKGGQSPLTHPAKSTQLREEGSPSKCVWRRAIDKKNRIYYFHIETRETSWHVPAGLNEDEIPLVRTEDQRRRLDEENMKDGMRHEEIPMPEMIHAGEEDIDGNNSDGFYTPSMCSMRDDENTVDESVVLPVINSEEVADEPVVVDMTSTQKQNDEMIACDREAEQFQGEMEVLDSVDDGTSTTTDDKTANNDTEEKDLEPINVQRHEDRATTSNNVAVEEAPLDNDQLNVTQEQQQVQDQDYDKNNDEYNHDDDDNDERNNFYCYSEDNNIIEVEEVAADDVFQGYSFDPYSEDAWIADVNDDSETIEIGNNGRNTYENIKVRYVAILKTGSHRSNVDEEEGESGSSSPRSFGSNEQFNAGAELPPKVVVVKHKNVPVVKETHADKQYNEAFLREQRKQNVRDQLKQKEEDELLYTHTFRPRVSSNNDGRVNEDPAESKRRLLAPKESQRTVLLRKEKEEKQREEEDAQCTFKPILSKKTEQIIKNRSKFFSTRGNCVSPTRSGEIRMKEKEKDQLVLKQQQHNMAKSRYMRTSMGSNPNCEISAITSPLNTGAKFDFKEPSLTPNVSRVELSQQTKDYLHTPVFQRVSTTFTSAALNQSIHSNPASPRNNINRRTSKRDSNVNRPPTTDPELAELEKDMAALNDEIECLDAENSYHHLKDETDDQIAFSPEMNTSVSGFTQIIDTSIATPRGSVRQKTFFNDQNSPEQKTPTWIADAKIPPLHIEDIDRTSAETPSSRSSRARVQSLSRSTRASDNQDASLEREALQRIKSRDSLPDSQEKYVSDENSQHESSSPPPAAQSARSSSRVPVVRSTRTSRLREESLSRADSKSRANSYERRSASRTGRASQSDSLAGLYGDDDLIENQVDILNGNISHRSGQNSYRGRQRDGASMNTQLDSARSRSSSTAQTPRGKGFNSTSSRFDTEIRHYHAKPDPEALNPSEEFAQIISRMEERTMLSTAKKDAKLKAEEAERQRQVHVQLNESSQKILDNSEKPKDFYDRLNISQYQRARASDLAAMKHKVHAEETFRPEINALSKQLPRKTVDELSSGDFTKQKRTMQAKRIKKMRDELASATFAPSRIINNQYERQESSLSINSINSDYMATVRAIEREKQRRTDESIRSREEQALRECTFTPRKTKLPKYVSQQAASHRAKLALQPKNTEPTKSDWK